MAYRLKKRAGIATGVRRIVHEELAKATDELEGRRSEDTATAIHEARKHLKNFELVVIVAVVLGVAGYLLWRRFRRAGSLQEH